MNYQKTLEKLWGICIFISVLIMFLAAGASHGAALPGKASKQPAALPESKLDPGDWKKVLEAAKKEGKIVIAGVPSEEWRKVQVDLFREEYPEINVEYIGIAGRDFWPRVHKERDLGQKLWDLRAGGVDAQGYDAKKEGLLDPIRPLLLPEVADDSKWIGGLNDLFSDRENKFMAAYTITIQRTTAVNRDFIKEGEIKSSFQLLDPKFRGKIVMKPPTGGSTYSSLANLAFMHGSNFVRDLVTKQNIAVTNDGRQQTEWVVRGRYPIAVGFDATLLVPFVKQGLGKRVAKLEDKLIPVGTGFGGISLIKDAPHPNAAKVYLNWLLSRNAQAKLAQSVELNSRRRDVPPVVKDLAVDPLHLNNYRLYSSEENVEVSDRLLKEALKNFNY